MTTNTILQLARFNSTNSPNSAEWTTTLREPVILNEGDTLSVRQAFVDSRLHSSTNIVIPVDLPVSLTFYFYVMFPADKLSWQEADVVDASTYYQFDANETNFASWTWKTSATDYVAMAGPNYYAAPAGAYVQRLQKPLPTYETGRSYPVAPTQDPYGTLVWDANINQCAADEIPMLLITNDIVGIGYPLENTPITKTWRYTIKAGSYDPAELADLLTKNMAEIQPDKTSPSYSPYELFGGTNPPLLNNFLQKGTLIYAAENQNVSGLDLPTAITAGRYGDSLVQEGNMLFSSNSDAFANQPQHTGVFSNFLVDTPINTNYLDQAFYDVYGDYKHAYEANIGAQAQNPIMFMPCHYAGTVITATGASKTDDASPQLANYFRTYNSSVVGASEISLEFNTETSLFQFTYLHSPIQELPLTAGTSSASASEPIEVVKICKSVNINRYNKDVNSDAPQSFATNYADGEVKICEQTRHSGIFFQSMEPVDFWQNIMGFDVPNITVPLSKVWGVGRSLTFAEFNKVTTSGYVGIENNFNLTATGTPTSSTQTLVVPNKNAPAYIAPVPLVENSANPNAGVFSYTQLLNSDQWILEHYVLKNDFTPAFDEPLDPENNILPYYDYGAIAGPNSDFYEEYSSALNATNPLSAIQIPLSQNNGTGHYFIEVVGYNNNVNDFINDNSIYAIKSIVASYYVSPNSFVTQPFQDTAIYEHIGDTQYINKFRVRLLDPLTMLPTAPLGPNSSVYLQLGKQMTKLAISQPN